MGDAVDNFKINLQAELERRGMSARQLSLKAGLGADAIRDLYRKPGGLTLRTATQLAHALNMPLTQLTGDMEPIESPHLRAVLKRLPADKVELAAKLLETIATH